MFVTPSYPTFKWKIVSGTSKNCKRRNILPIYCPLIVNNFPGKHMLQFYKLWFISPVLASLVIPRLALAFLVLSGFTPRAGGSVSIFEAVEMTPLPKLTYGFHCTPLQLFAAIPIARWNSALAVLAIKAPDSSALAGRDFGPLPDEIAWRQTEFFFPNISTQNVNRAICEPHSARLSNHCSVSLDEQTTFPGAVHMNAFGLVEP